MYSLPSDTSLMKSKIMGWAEHAEYKQDEESFCLMYQLNVLGIHGITDVTLLPSCFGMTVPSSGNLREA